MSSSSSSSSSPAVSKGSLHSQPFDYYIVLDFEASCEDNNRSFLNEVIEFPSVLIDAKTLEVVGEFHYYVKPLVNPKLTAFCTELTGITQDRVEKAREFPEVLKLYKEWLVKKNLGLDFQNKKFTFVTCGDWDLKTMLPTQCRTSKLEVPVICKSWINIKKAYADFYKRKVNGMTDMLDALKLGLIGRHHSGIDDTRNIARILVKMMQDGAVMRETWTIKV